jgi:metal-dependent HD superfamily phosphatase/phosphodiesterase
MASESALEKELDNRAKVDGEARTLKQSYDQIKTYLVKNYYPWVQAQCPFYTDHGEAHIASVMHSASELTSERMTVTEGRASLSALDIYLILTAILWHDVGMVINRAKHAELVVEMSDKVKEMFPNTEVKDLVSKIAKAHKGPTGLDNLKVEDYCHVDGPAQELNPALLAAIVRFADEISENHTRASRQVLDLVPVDQKIFWLYALSVRTCTAQPNRDRVLIHYRFDADRVVSTWPSKEFHDFCAKPELTIPLLTYALCRLEKLNNEREYCLRCFSSVAPIRKVDVQISITHNGTELPGYEGITTTLKGGGVEPNGYPAIKIVSEFFKSNPKWDIQSIQGAIKT